MKHRCALFLALLVSLAAPALQATSYVMVPDEALVDGAPAAAVVRIVAVDREVAVRAGGRPVTEYRAEVEELLKGDLPAGEVRVLVPGGMGPGGVGLAIHGAPSFLPGDRALLFLEPDGHGAFRVFHFLLGAFLEAPAGARKLAVRSLAEASEVRVTANGVEPVLPAGQDLARDFRRFSDWVAARGRGEKRPADYLVSEKEGQKGLQRIAERYTLFRAADGLPMRWFEFDEGESISWRAHATGQQGLSGGGYSELQTALQVWNADPSTPIDYRYAGTTSASLGLTGDDRINTVLFNDPNSEVSSYTCAVGGTLALAGPWYLSGRRTFRGQEYHPVIEADVVFNNGLSCFFAASPNASKVAEEILAHEIGHTLGIRHSCGDSFSPSCATSATLDDALMRARVHDDGRGARLGGDDRAALLFLYPATAAGSPPAAPSGLAAAGVSTTEIQLNWTDNATDETGFRLEMRATDGGTFTELSPIAANVTGAVVGGLTPATSYTFRLRAVNANGLSAFSNQATTSTFAQVTACVPDSRTLCLSGGRFRVQVDWESPQGGEGTGNVVPVESNDSGLFWFFGPDNWEMLVKVLDGCSVNSRYWVFLAATTTVEHLVTVTDTRTGARWTYSNPQGTRPQVVTDTAAFATCP